MAAFFAAFKFLTILPVPGAHRFRDKDWSLATAWYPAVGLVLGTILFALDWVLHWLWPGEVAAALVLAAWVAMTGALHLDGFVDCCDALLTAVPASRKLDILRDVHIGAFGAVGLVLLLLLKYACLLDLPHDLRLPAYLLVPVAARWAMTGAVLFFPYARRGSGLGQKAKATIGVRQFAIASTTALLVGLLCFWLGLGWAAWVLLVLAGALSLLVALWIQAQIQGLTGDAYGALCELAELVGLLTVLALAHQSLML